jgi:pilus assembly protein Flp/PilA
VNKLQTAIGVRLGLALAALSGPSLQRAFRREEGQTFVEYALILALISVALAASLTVLKGKIDAIFTKIGNDLGP